MKILHRIVLGAMVAALAACRQSPVTFAPRNTLEKDPRAPSMSCAFALFDDMETDQGWRVDSATDPATLAADDAHFSTGDKALAVSFHYAGTGKVEVRKEIDIDLWPARTAKLDAYVSQGPVDLAIAFRTRPGSAYFETRPITLQTGWNRDVTFPIAGSIFKDGERDGPYANPLRNAHRVSRLSFLLYEREQTEGTVYLDNLRFDAPKRDLIPGLAPLLLDASLSTMHPLRYEQVELSVRCKLTYDSPFDPREVRCWARIDPPHEAPLEAPGFFDGEDDEDPMVSHWKVRFTPRTPGQYHMTFVIANLKGEAVSDSFHFTCSQQAKGEGFVSTRRHHRYFSFSNGEIYLPLGQNVAWASDYEPYFKKMHAYGANFARIWMCPWNLPLENRDAVGTYNLQQARRLDHVLRVAGQYGIRIQLVLEYHGMLKASWKDNPYNAANGGPCYSPKEFFTDRTARTLFKRRMDYILARWSSSPDIAFWELWNEVNLTPFDKIEDVLQWHREMCFHLSRNDRYDHPVTTSGTGALRSKPLLALQCLDFYQVHNYSTTPPHAFEREFQHLMLKPKPFFVGEYGSGWRPEEDQKDHAGIRLHAGLWSSLLSPSAGCAMPWWWDTQIDPNNLYFHFAAVHAYLRGEDFRRTALHWQHGPVDPAHPDIHAWGLFGSDRAYVWLYNPAQVRHLDLAKHAFLSQPLVLPLSGLTHGKYRIEIWDTYAGRITDTGNETTVRDTLSISLPPSRQDIALKIKRIPESRPGLQTTNPMGPSAPHPADPR